MKYTHSILVLLFLLFNSLVVHADGNHLHDFQLVSSSEFAFTDQQSPSFVIRRLDQAHRKIDTLKEVEAIGVLYLGNITLSEEATPLSALRDISAQISQSMALNFALIADSTTSRSLAPHELLLLYHPTISITLALTKTSESDHYSLIGTYSMPVNAEAQSKSLQATVDAPGNE